MKRIVILKYIEFNVEKIFYLLRSTIIYNLCLINLYELTFKKITTENVLSG